MLRSFSRLPKQVKAYFLRYRVPNCDFPFEYCYGNYIYTFWSIDLPIEIRLSNYSCKTL